jgi:hypothetical protein
VNKTGQYVMCSDRMPTRSGEYLITNNSSCNDGHGTMRFDVASGWCIPDVIASFYMVVSWYEVS